MIYALDTNIFLRFLVHENEESYSLTSEIFQRVEDKKLNIVVPGVVINEVIWGLNSYYRYTKDQIIQVAEGIQRFEKSMIDNYDYGHAFALFREKNVKYVDCLIASIPKVMTKEWTVLSFDKDFKKLNTNWKTPQELLA